MLERPIASTLALLSMLLVGGAHAAPDVDPEAVLELDPVDDALAPTPMASCGGSNGKVGCCGNAEQCASGCNTDRCDPQSMCERSTCRQSQYYGRPR